MRIFQILTLIAILFPTLGWTSEILISIKPLYHIIYPLVKDIDNSSLFIEKHIDPHHYSLTPSDVVKVQKAEIIIITNRNFEYFLYQAAIKANPKAIVIEISEIPGINLLASNHSHTHENSHDDKHSHDDANMDYHLWLNPDNARVITEYLTDYLSQINSKHKLTYEERAQKLLTEISSFDMQAALLLKPHQTSGFLVLHDSYQYLEKKYNLNNQGAINLANGKRANIRDISKIQKMIAKNNIKCIFHEPYENATKITTIAGNHTKVKALDSEWGPIENNYILFMNNLIKDFTDCFYVK